LRFDVQGLESACTRTPVVNRIESSTSLHEQAQASGGGRGILWWWLACGAAAQTLREKQKPQGMNHEPQT